ncbi:MAG: hypothetical protein WC716_01920 [Chitinophagaceae bacterium]|jgi:tetratricopeptide (TPR) repeat protein
MGKFYQWHLSFLFVLLISNSGKAQHDFCKNEKWKDSAANVLFQQNYMSNRWQYICDSILTIWPEYDYIWQLKAMPRFKGGYYDCASLDKAVSINPEMRLPYRAFMKCTFAKDYFGAIVDLKAAEALIKGGGLMDHSFSFYLGLCYLGIEQADSAVRYFEKDIAHQSQTMGKGNEHYNSLFYLGLSYLQANQVSKAEKYLKASIKGYSRFPEPNFYLGKLRVLKNEKKEAKRDFEQSKKFLLEGATMNEDNNFYVDYPFQIGLSDIEKELEQQ